jgi:DNA polymerase
MSEDKNEKLDELINQTQNYLQNFNRFYSDTLYISSDESIKSQAESLINEPEKEIPTETMTTKQEKKAIKEVDLFGNETVKKEEWEFAESLEELDRMIHDCKKCPLWETRTNFVFGVGNPKADIVVIGEAPGADEDAKGEPFVGRAGQLLNKILEATGFKREEVFICNILKSRPPGNRNPLPSEVEACKPYLDKQLKLINPKLILLLGRVAAESLLKSKEPLNKMRGKTHDYKGWKVRITFHPAALLRNPNWKKDTWEDMKQFKTMYDELVASM